MSDRICSTPGCGGRMIYVTARLCKRCYANATRPRRSDRLSKFTPDVVRFEAKITAGPDGCWIWMGPKNRADGYGWINLQGRIRAYAHRWSYEYHRATIPVALELDHLCRTPSCVNPWHLEPVTGAVNKARTREPFCGRGHEMTPQNTYVRPDGKGRMCRACRQDAQRARRRPAA